MTVKETYHADCLRIKQLTQQLAECKEHNGNIVDKWNDLKQQLADKEAYCKELIDCSDIKKLEQQLALAYDIVKWFSERKYLYDHPQNMHREYIVDKIKEFESEQND